MLEYISGRPNFGPNTGDLHVGHPRERRPPRQPAQRSHLSEDEGEEESAGDAVVLVTRELHEHRRLEELSEAIASCGDELLADPHKAREVDDVVRDVIRAPLPGVLFQQREDGLEVLVRGNGAGVG